MPVARTHVSFGIVYASLSGSTLRIAEYVQQCIHESDLTVQTELLDMLVADPQSFSSFDILIMGTSTHGEGALNPFAEVFVASLQGREGEQLWNGIPFAVFGAGDSRYLDFCTAPDILSTVIENQGGVVVAPVLKIDVFTEDWDQQQAKLSAWVDVVLKMLRERKTPELIGS